MLQELRAYIADHRGEPGTTIVLMHEVPEQVAADLYLEFGTELQFTSDRLTVDSYWGSFGVVPVPGENRVRGFLLTEPRYTLQAEPDGVLVVETGDAVYPAVPRTSTSSTYRPGTSSWTPWAWSMPSSSGTPRPGSCSPTARRRTRSTRVGRPRNRAG